MFCYTLFLTIAFLSSTSLADKDPRITPAPVPVKRQLPDDLSSAREYLSTCQEACTDDIQSTIIDSRLKLQKDDEYCNNYGNKQGDGEACYCGNLIQNIDAHISALKTCIKDTCTDMSDEAFTYLGVGKDAKVSAYAMQLGRECSMKVHLFEKTIFPGVSSTPPESSSEIPSTTVPPSSSAPPSSSSTLPSSSDAPSNAPSSIIPSASQQSASSSPSSDAAMGRLSMPDTAFVATLLCGAIMAVTVYAL